jgi:hypothetical protein
MPTFHTTLTPAENRSAMGIDVPEDIVTALGGGRKPAVRVSVNGYVYRSTVFFMDGRFQIPFASEHRKASGIGADEPIEVELTLDTEPRIVEVPADFAEALDKAGLRAAFDKLAFTHRKEHVRAIEEAKAADTRARRIVKAIEKIGG